MQKIIFYLGLVALTSAQFPHHPDYLNIPGVAPPPWTGPLSDHINGIPPKDTPEVAAAKQALNQAYAQVLAVLPELPPEERYRETPGISVHVPQHHHVHNLGYNNIFPQVPQHVGPQLQHVHTPSQQLAEEIPRSVIGEVPEVHAARVAHLKAFQEVAATLPRHTDTYNHNVHHHVPPVVSQYHNLPGHQVQDTPEVARAKAEHAAALAALG